jgi:hypothetical protein
VAFGTTSALAAKQHQPDGSVIIDRHALHPQRSENAQSGTDTEVANHEISFDPKETSPEGEAAASRRESQQQGKASSPLDVSPANEESSKARDPTEGGAESGMPKDYSTKGWTKKGKKVNQ